MNIKIRPEKSYSDAATYKYIIYRENRNKSGIYRINNIITGDFYIGSAANLTNRLRSYFSVKALNRVLQRNKSLICSSLLKYGHSNFSIDILEYCNKESRIIREQYYLDLLQPQYNILKTAGSFLGMKHSPETLLKFKSRKHSSNALANLCRAKAVCNS
jgi:group I intron endonuclease